MLEQFFWSATPDTQLIQGEYDLSLIFPWSFCR